MKKLIEDIQKPTPPKNKRIGKFLTVLGGVAEGIALSGQIDHLPKLKLALHLTAIVLGGASLYNAQKVDENAETN